ncbi:MAG: hypothetical protein KKA79_05280 [Nanoarchaeota archaeon]|nr:hypothetical protein [Nanoarchaeota archaeon]
MKLPKKIQGKNLINIVVKSLESEGYKTSVKQKIDPQRDLSLGILRAYYDNCPKDFDFDIPNEYNITGHKYKDKLIGLSFQGKAKIIYLIPIIGWLMYVKEKNCHNIIDNTIKVCLDTGKEYDELNLRTTRTNHYTGLPQGDYKENINKESLKLHPNLKKDLEGIEQIIYERTK